MIFHGDCLERLRELEAGSLDSMVTDPPAGIAFMGKGWDTDKGGREFWIAWLTEVMTEACRVLKPGAHALVWAIPRTSHWTMTALENAGFEIRDVVTHLFGSGFPKSLDVSKAIDKAAGVERAITGPKSTYRKPQAPNGWDCSKRAEFETAPATPDAEKWQGFGTALKPACEFWILCRKPLGEKTVAANVLRHGTGALNIDASRIEGPKRSPGFKDPESKGQFGSSDNSNLVDWDASQGRFPANLVLSHSDGCKLVGTKKVKTAMGVRGSHASQENYRLSSEVGQTVGYGDGDGTETVEAWECEPDCAVRMLDEQSGDRPVSGTARLGKANKAGKAFFGSCEQGFQSAMPNDSGGASRFFYCAKASRSDRQRKATDGK